MRARAPGKVVISGAYAVLSGAPAIVSAVDRYALADSSARAEFTTSEVEAAIQLGWLRDAPAFDSSQQRMGQRKLGLGSSAAILVASLYAARPELSRDQLFQAALAAHRRAQGGGSGVDVAASVYGGTQSYRLDDLGAPTMSPVSLPRGLVLEVWSSPVEARTSDLIRAVDATRASAKERHAAVLRELTRASEVALTAARDDRIDDFLRALRVQARGLSELGLLAGVPITTDAVLALDAGARAEGAVVLPAGAGGGDVCLFAGGAAPSPALVELGQSLSHEPLDVTLNAPGAALLSRPSP